MTKNKKGVIRKIICRNGVTRRYRIKNMKRFKKRYSKTKEGFINKRLLEGGEVKEGKYVTGQIYRSTATFVYEPNDKRNNITEVRIWIYHTTPFMTISELESKMEELIEHEGVIFVSPKLVIGSELNEETDEVGINLNNFNGYIHFKKHGQRRPVWSANYTNSGGGWK